MIPLPSLFVDFLMTFLQTVMSWSAEISYPLSKLVGEGIDLGYIYIYIYIYMNEYPNGVSVLSQQKNSLYCLCFLLSFGF